MQTNSYSDSFNVKILVNDCGNPAGKLADAELYFSGNSALAGLKLIGFAIWKSRTSTGGNVTSRRVSNRSMATVAALHCCVP
jgi:hypothetical protein